MEQSAVQDILIRKIDVSIVDKLKLKARTQNRSLQAEVKMILQDAASRPDPLSRLETIRKIRDSISNKNQTDSAVLLREDRDR